ncbi:MAG: DUF2141 domain-containing protein [Alistipes sp.]|nr:DUF2141 domain-containing protein [Alistipes sp.]
MKKMTIFAAVTGLFMMGSAAASARETGGLDIKVDGLRSDDGKVMLAVMREDMSRKDWTRFDPRSTEWSSLILYAASESSSTEGTEFHVQGLPEGEKLYLYLFHDENGNGRMDLSEQMLPREGFVKGDGETIPSVTITGRDQEVSVTTTYL